MTEIKNDMNDENLEITYSVLKVGLEGATLQYRSKSAGFYSDEMIKSAKKAMNKAKTALDDFMEKYPEFLI